MIVDASAIVAILTCEAEADRLADILESAEDPITTPIAVFESVAGLCRKRQMEVSVALDHVESFLAMAGVKVSPIVPEEGKAALSAFARYGKGRGHPAQLNLGDCFAYAAARVRGRPLLFKGDDFAATDIASA